MFNTFDGVVIFVSIWLFSRMVFKPVKDKSFVAISFFVMCFILFSDNLAHHFFLDIRMAKGNGWMIYWIYSAVNAFAMLALWKYRAHMLIMLILAMNTLLNIVAAQYYTSHWMPDAVYNVYPYPAGALALCALFYQWCLNGSNIFDRKVNKSNVVGFLWRRSLGYPFGDNNRSLQ